MANALSDAAPRESATVAYRALCAITGALLALGGTALLLGSLRALAPGAAELVPGVPFGPPALYFVAFAGCALVGWGGALAAAAREPTRGVGTWSAVALTAMAVYRMAVWFMGEAFLPPALLRAEAAIFLVLALAFVWLRPRARERS